MPHSSPRTPRQVTKPDTEATATIPTEATISFVFGSPSGIDRASDQWSRLAEDVKRMIDYNDNACLRMTELARSLEGRITLGWESFRLVRNMFERGGWIDPTKYDLVTLCRQAWADARAIRAQSGSRPLPQLPPMPECYTVPDRVTNALDSLDAWYESAVQTVKPKFVPPKIQKTKTSSPGKAEKRARFARLQQSISNLHINGDSHGKTAVKAAADNVIRGFACLCEREITAAFVKSCLTRSRKRSKGKQPT